MQGKVCRLGISQWKLLFQPLGEAAPEALPGDFLGAQAAVHLQQGRAEAAPPPQPHLRVSDDLVGPRL